jgi:signal transduction histidine kinase/serine phosphatase RsbU (regulator of sigma subunit)/DNA-binding response OmpR family regulator/anti-sigma regulatory factor (Ser/Thr protein kinase)
MWLCPRDGHLAERYFTLSHSAVRDERGGIRGVLSMLFGATGQVLGERRRSMLRDLAEQTAEACTPEEVCERAARALERYPAEFPFVLLYVVDEEQKVARVAGVSGITRDEDRVPATVDLTEVSGWHLSAAAGGEIVLLEELPGGLHPGAPHLGTPHAPPPDRALVLPLQAGLPQPEGLLVVGISSARALDGVHREFCRQVAGHIAGAMVKARMEEAERRAEALAALHRARTAFFGDVSHEFRTPLTLLRGLIEDALQDDENPPSTQQRERLETARRNATRLLGLVNNLLDLSKLEEGRLEAWYEPTDIGTLTREVASVFRFGIERAGLQFVVDCPVLEPVHVDRSMWEKIVLNLVSNALKFTLSGEIAVRIRRDGDWAVLEVADTGIGIPQDEIPRIFDRYHRACTAQSVTPAGTGIGLALVRELVELHGGTIDVRAAVGKGSSFTVRVPMGTAHLPEDRLGSPCHRADADLMTEPHVEDATCWMSDVEELDAAKGYERDHGRILLVDDNADMRCYVTRLLSKHWEVEAVGDGLAALAAARKQVPDLVLTDVMMPGLDGLHLLRSLREDPETRCVPVVLLSARAGEEAAIEGLNAGADDYLVKPFSARELVARVRVNLEMARTRELAACRAAEHTRVVNGLAAAAKVLTSAASLENVLRAVTDQARELIGAHQAGTSMLVNHDWSQAITVMSLSEKYAAYRDYDELPDGSGIYASVCRNNRPMRLTQAELEAHPEWRGFGQSIDRHPPMRGWLAVPLVGRDGENLGLIQLSDKYEDEFTDQDLAILKQLAAIASVRIERARVEDRIRQVCDTLQYSLLPSRLPKLDHAQVGARYLPGSRDINVGGDWYDVVVMPGGRILVAVGDVVGHGERAAAAMGQLRNALRAYASEGLGPATLLERLNRLGKALDEQYFSTVACLCFDPRTGLLQHANAGHPPPVIIDSDGTARFMRGARGVPIGAVGRTSYTEIETTISPGATLLLYTDGLVESRTRGLDQGLNDLVTALVEGPGDLEDLLDHVLATVPDKARDDDLALVGLRVLDQPVTNLELRLPAEPSALALLRSQVRDFLRRAGVPDDDAYEMLVALGEAAANAIQHPIAPTEPFIEVSLTVAAGEIVAIVRDFGRWNDEVKEDSGNGRLLMAALAEVDIKEHPGGTAVTLRRALEELV